MAKPADQYCGQCGSPLGTDPVSSADVRISHIPVVSAKILSAALAIILITAIGVAAILMTGPGIMRGHQGAGNTSPAPASYIIIETEVPLTPAPTFTLPAATPFPTTILTTISTPKHNTCSSDRRLCGTNCTDTQTDRGNCGYCGNACAKGQACVNGHCMPDCPTGKTACVEGCFNLQTDPDHCGICTNNCPAGLVCEKGQCAPPPTKINRALQ